MKQRPLPPRQQRFVDEYLVDLSTTQAVKRAAYECTDTGTYYVYFLVDPRDDEIFYVGKGKGLRMHLHEKQAFAGVVSNAPKHARVCEIHYKGLRVRPFVFFRTDDEGAAYAVERVLIKALRDGLTNVAGGIVTNEQATAERAKYLFNQLESYIAWSCRRLTKEKCGLMADLGETPLSFYGKISKQLLMIGLYGSGRTV